MADRMGADTLMRRFGYVVLLGPVAGLVALTDCTQPPRLEGSCQVNSALTCDTVLAGDKDAGVPLGLVGYSCDGVMRPDYNATYVSGVPYGQICADMTAHPDGGATPTTRDYCCTPDTDMANCAYNPVAVCPEGYGYQCWGQNRPEVHHPGVTCGNGVREGEYVNYCCQGQGRPVGCTQAKGAISCSGGLIGWVCPPGSRPRGEDFGANESRADYYYFVCGVPTPAPNGRDGVYCCFSPAPVQPGGSCVYSPGSAPDIPGCTAGRFAFACYGRDTPDQDFYPRISCKEPSIQGKSDEGYAASLYCCDYLPPGMGSGAGTDIDE
jgi:hypothetical protein